MTQTSADHGPGVPQMLQTPRTALVTGAGRGIGRALALGLAREGWAVALVGRTGAHLQAVAHEAVEAGAEHEPLVAEVDVVDRGAVRAAVAAVEEGFVDHGGLGLLVNNAGVIERSEVPFGEDDLDDLWRVVEVNVRGPLTVTREVLPGMISRGGGRVVNINSGSGHRASPTYTGYGISKGALSRFTTLLDAQYRDQGIRVFDLAPGVVVTDMTRQMPLHEGRSDWTPVEASVDLLLAMGAGELDALSGRFVRAGSDTPASLQTHTYEIVVNDARRLRLVGFGPEDPVQ
ncbi:SDR family NAD(P)-dependent oxidoreductase [Cellulomonas bogoriensis]|uniref:Short-chain dehydrogenase n=1 Tax=Cellulomonas bogoriensis 69B4 = DSM 16987 TaxID=1386082 RepID=A0A0A0BX38_9CELL|nr:SDR family oxidoreductase [Cellulomonas bogoriensis]KGM12973.1 short-chain dehydrogenase [Cellulomonas bogoriensis 69B4 = DSM 16987]